MKIFKNKVAIITGSSQGIGKALAKKFASIGAKVVINSENQEQLESTYEEFKKENLNAFPIVADITKIDSCKNLIAKTIEHYGQVDILVNNAGITMETSVEEASPESFKKVVEVNLIGANACTHFAIPHLKKTNGQVLFISSLAAIHGIPTATAYCSSKMALTAYVEALKTELHQSDVHVGIVYLGFTENDPQKKMLDKQGVFIPLTVRNDVKRQSVEAVSTNILKFLKDRRFKKVFSPLGKLHLLTNRISPDLVQWILRRNYLSK